MRKVLPYFFPPSLCPLQLRLSDVPLRVIRTKLLQNNARNTEGSRTIGCLARNVIWGYEWLRATRTHQIKVDSSPAIFASVSHKGRRERGGRRDNNQREILTHCFFLRLDLIFAMLVTHERYFFLMSPPLGVKPWPLFSSKVSYAGADNISWRQNGIVRIWEQTRKLFGRLASRFNIIQRRGGLDRGRDGGEARAQCHILPGIVAHASMARSHRRMRQTPQQPRQVPTLPRGEQLSLSAHHVG